MAAPRLPVFHKFIDDCATSGAPKPTRKGAWSEPCRFSSELLMDDDLQSAFGDWPSTEGRKNLLLYVDPDYGFAINAVVRIPGRRGSVHDHACAWVVYGVLTGTESLERFERIDDGTSPAVPTCA